MYDFRGNQQFQGFIQAQNNYLSAVMEQADQETSGSLIPSWLSKTSFFSKGSPWKSLPIDHYPIALEAYCANAAARTGPNRKPLIATMHAKDLVQPKILKGLLESGNLGVCLEILRKHLDPDGRAITYWFGEMMLEARHDPKDPKITIGLLRAVGQIQEQSPLLAMALLRHHRQAAPEIDQLLDRISSIKMKPTWRKAIPMPEEFGHAWVAIARLYPRASGDTASKLIRAAGLIRNQDISIPPFDGLELGWNETLANNPATSKQEREGAMAIQNAALVFHANRNDIPALPLDEILTALAV